jgi:protein TonB
MFRLTLLGVIGSTLAIAILVAAQETAPPPQSPQMPQYMKVCSSKNPPPCATAPSVIYSSNAEYSEDARRAGIEGIVVLWTIVGVDGRAHNIRVTRFLGHGLDEQAIETLKQWKFKPGVSDGAPVPVAVNLQVSFRLH